MPKNRNFPVPETEDVQDALKYRKTEPNLGGGRCLDISEMTLRIRPGTPIIALRYTVLSPNHTLTFPSRKQHTFPDSGGLRISIQNWRTNPGRRHHHEDSTHASLVKTALCPWSSFRTGDTADSISRVRSLDSGSVLCFSDGVLRGSGTAAPCSIVEQVGLSSAMRQSLTSRQATRLPRL